MCFFPHQSVFVCICQKGWICLYWSVFVREGARCLCLSVFVREGARCLYLSLFVYICQRGGKIHVDKALAGIGCPPPPFPLTDSFSALSPSVKEDTTKCPLSTMTMVMRMTMTMVMRMAMMILPSRRMHQSGSAMRHEDHDHHYWSWRRWGWWLWEK